MRRYWERCGWQSGMFSLCLSRRVVAFTGTLRTTLLGFLRRQRTYLWWGGSLTWCVWKREPLAGVVRGGGYEIAGSERCVAVVVYAVGAVLRVGGGFGYEEGA